MHGAPMDLENPGMMQDIVFSSDSEKIAYRAWVEACRSLQALHFKYKKLLKEELETRTYLCKIIAPNMSETMVDTGGILNQ